VARYWVYLNSEVAGPYGVDQLIRLRGFSRQTQVCVDEMDGKPKVWISPAEIPELAHIFKAVDEHQAEPANPAPKSPAKSPAARPAKPFVPAVTLRASKRNIPQMWGWILLATALLGGGAFVWSIYSHRNVQASERQAAQALIENIHLPAPSPYSTLPQYFQEKNLRPRWDFERKPEGLYGVTLSWYAPTLSVYAFEVNLQAQTVRGLNSAASKLLSEGFPAPPSRRAKAAPAPKKSPAESFSPTLDGARAAVESGDFQTVWNLYSERKKAEMSKAGISQDGFVRLQGLTHKVESPAKQTVLKTKPQSETEMLALIKQTQDGHPDVFIKQFWVYENGAWKLDDEQKKSSTASAARPAATEPITAPSPVTPPAPSPEPTAPATKPAPATLPGMSN
jgi:hypothetical protein